MQTILFVVPRLFLGGAETQFRRLIHYLSQYYDITLIALYKTNNDREYVKKYTNVDLKYIGINRYDKFRDFRFSSLLYLVNYAIVYFQLVFFFLKRGGYPVVVSYASVIAPLIPVIKLFNNNLLFSVRTASDKLFRRRYMRFLLKVPDVVTCNSPVTKDLLKDLGIQNVQVVLNGIEVEGKQILSKSYSKKLTDIVNISRISPDKNQLVLLKALKELDDKKLLIVGQVVDERYHQKLKAFISEYNLKDRVEFLGYTSDVVSIYDKADLIVLPSYEEGLSNVLVESLLYGRYCIASNIPANKFVLEGRGGLFDPDEPAGLIKEINRFEQYNISEKEEIILANHQYAVETFNVDQFINKYRKLIQGLI